MILKWWSWKDTLNEPTCRLQKITRVPSAGHAKIQKREEKRHFQKDRQGFPLQRDRSPHHPKDRHSDPPKKRDT